MSEKEAAFLDAAVNDEKRKKKEWKKAKKAGESREAFEERWSLDSRGEELHRERERERLEGMFRHQPTMKEIENRDYLYGVEEEALEEKVEKMVGVCGGCEVGEEGGGGGDIAGASLRGPADCDAMGEGGRRG